MCVMENEKLECMGCGCMCVRARARTQVQEFMNGVYPSLYSPLYFLETKSSGPGARWMNNNTNDPPVFETRKPLEGTGMQKITPAFL